MTGKIYADDREASTGKLFEKLSIDPCITPHAWNEEYYRTISPVDVHVQISSTRSYGPLDAITFHSHLPTMHTQAQSLCKAPLPEVPHDEKLVHDTDPGLFHELPEGPDAFKILVFSDELFQELGIP